MASHLSTSTNYMSVNFFKVLLLLSHADRLVEEVTEAASNLCHLIYEHDLVRNFAFHYAVNETIFLCGSPQAILLKEKYEQKYTKLPSFANILDEQDTNHIVSLVDLISPPTYTFH